MAFTPVLFLRNGRYAIGRTAANAAALERAGWTPQDATLEGNEDALDDVFRDLVTNPASEVRAALGAAFGTRSGTRPAGVAEIIINADDYGVARDGITDDTAALDAAFAAAAAAARSTSVLGATAVLQLRAGRYIDNGSRSISTRVVVRGEGKLNTILFRKAGASGDYLTLGNQYSSVEGVTIDGNRANCPAAGDNLVLNAYRTAARNVLIRNAKANGITIGKTAAALGWELSQIVLTQCTGYGVLVSSAFGSTDGVWLGGDVGKCGLSGVRLSTGAQNLSLVHSWGNGLESATDNHGFYVDSPGNLLAECQGETNLGSGVLVEGSDNHGNRVTGKYWGNAKSGIKINGATKGTVNAQVYRNACGNTAAATTAEFAAVHNIDGRQWSFSINAWDDSAAVSAGSYAPNGGDPGNSGYVPTFPFTGRAGGTMYQSYNYAEEGALPEHNAFNGCVARKEETLSQVAWLVVAIYNRMSPMSNNWGLPAIPSRPIVSGVVRCPPEADTVFISSNAILNTMSGGYAGRRCTLIWSATAPLQVTHGTGTNAFDLAGQVSWTPARWASLTVVFDGTHWYETSRKA